MHIFRDLAQRARADGPIRVGVVGAGYFAASLVRQLARVEGLTPAVVANRTLDRALAALASAGFEPRAIEVADDPDTARRALERGRPIASTNLLLPAQTPGVEVVMEATGDVLVGTRVAHEAILNRKHVVAANAEVHATVGPILKHLADRAGVVYSDVDGDEPGILANLLAYCRGLGFEPIVAGNCKGVLKRYATPATQAAFAEAVLYRQATVAPLGPPIAEVATFAKQDVAAGVRLDGIGGHHAYGLIARADEAAAERLLPVCLSGACRLTRLIRKDAPITRDDVEVLEDNLVLELRRRQEAWFSHPTAAVRP